MKHLNIKIKAKIYLFGLPHEKPEFIESYQGNLKGLKAKLFNLQLGYCEDEKPSIEKVTDTMYESRSDSDFNYVALLK